MPLLQALWGSLCLSLLLVGRRTSPAFTYKATDINLIARVVIILIHFIHIEVGKVLIVLLVGRLCFELVL